MAEQLAAKLNNKLNYQPKDDEDKMDDESEQTFRKYEEELEINDFPQQARWRVTSKVGPGFPFLIKNMLQSYNLTIDKTLAGLFRLRIYKMQVKKTLLFAISIFLHPS